MPAIQRISDRMALADVVAFDRDDKPILMASAEEQVAEPQILESYLEVLQSIRRNIPFAILANIETMTLYRKHRTRSLEPVATIPTQEVIGFYYPRWVGKRVSKVFIAGTIDAWLRDFMRHWTSPTPPCSETMASLGLVERLEKGWTKERVRLACLPVRRDELPDQLRNGTELGSRPHPVEPALIPPVDHP